jgi:hypothetical protein
MSLIIDFANLRDSFTAFITTLLSVAVDRTHVIIKENPLEPYSEKGGMI